MGAILISAMGPILIAILITILITISVKLAAEKAEVRFYKFLAMKAMEAMEDEDDGIRLLSEELDYYRDGDVFHEKYIVGALINEEGSGSVWKIIDHNGNRKRVKIMDLGRNEESQIRRRKACIREYNMTRKVFSDEIVEVSLFMDNVHMIANPKAYLIMPYSELKEKEIETLYKLVSFYISQSEKEKSKREKAQFEAKQKLKKEREKFEYQDKTKDKLITFYKLQSEKEKLDRENAQCKAEKKLKKEFEIRMQLIEWQWNDGYKWISYTDTMSEDIEHCSIDDSCKYTFVGNAQTYRYIVIKTSINSAVQTNIKTKKECKVRRITKSIQSEETKEETKEECDKNKVMEFVYTVEWQWNVDNDKWTAYDDCMNQKIDVLTVNKSYQFKCSANNQTYKITRYSTNDGDQINVKTKVWRKIRRKEHLLVTFAEETNPKWWKIHVTCVDYAKPHINVLNFNINQTAKQVTKLFNDTAKGYEVMKIESVENQMLYDAFLNEKNKVIKLIGKKKLNIKLLFHGTKESVMDTVIIEGFRKEFNSKAVWGEGTYFAQNATYSLRYASVKKSNGSGRMFMCMVICGESVTGNKSYHLKTWPKKSNGLIYDSLVNDEENPTICVIHENFRVYPMFIVHFCKSTLLPCFNYCHVLV